MKVNEIFFALIRNEIFGEPLPSEVAEALDNETLAKLYRISKRQDLAHLICDALEKNDLLPNESEFAAKFRKQHLLAVYRYERINFELGMASKTLENAKIPFIPLKGSVMRAYYPEPWMRTSCDIDVLVREENLEKSRNVLVSDLNYIEERKEIHDISMISPSGIHFELHFAIIVDNRSANAKNILCNVWNNAKSEFGDYKYVMNDDMFYLYHVAHIAKHIMNGGCGVRPFLDLYLLDTKVEHNEEKRNELLEKAGLLKFADTARQLSRKWFAHGETNDTLDTLEAFIFEGNTYGSIKNGIVMDMVKKGSRSKYILSRLFMPYDQLKVKYPIIEKYRILTPLFEVVRWFSVLSPARMKRTKNELDISGDSWNVGKVEKFFEDMGLQKGKDE